MIMFVARDEHPRLVEDRASRVERYRGRPVVTRAGVASPSRTVSMFVNTAIDPWIYGYPQTASVFQGGTLQLHYLTNQPQFRFLIYRQGAADANGGLVLTTTSGWTNVTPDTGVVGPRNAAVDDLADWSWPSVDVSIPDTWSPGVYVVMFEAADGSGTQTVGPSVGTYVSSVPWSPMAQALFVVRRAPTEAPAAVLYKVPVATYHAYNRGTPDGLARSFYDQQGLGSVSNGAPHVGYRITTRRPGGGTGAPVSIGTDPFDTGTTPYNTFAHWDSRMIGWLEANGFPPGSLDYCTDFDLDADAHVLDGTRLLLSAGHDEYWSAAMRDAAEAFVARGGNIAFFSGNNCYWRIYVADDAVVCDKRLADGTYTGYDGADIWWRQRPENALTGPASRNGGGDYNTGGSGGPGFLIQRSGDWLLANTGLTDGATLGTAGHLVNYEADGVAYNTDAGGLLSPSELDGTPSTFRIQGSALLDTYWTRLPRELAVTSAYAATMGYYSRVGTVFCAATTDWARVLAQADGAVAQITSNVVNALQTPAQVSCCADFNGDGVADICLVNPTSRALYVWFMTGAGTNSSAYADLMGPVGWNMVAAADMNADGKPDFLWYNPTSGQVSIWFLDGLHVVNGVLIGTTQDPAWALVAAGDLNGDGQPDLIFQNQATGQLLVWYMNGTAVVTSENITPGVADKLIAAVDLTGDGKTDLLFHNPATGQVSVWLMTSWGANYTNGYTLDPNTTSEWLVVGAGNFKVSADSPCQILLQNTVNSQLQLWVLAADGHTVTDTIPISAIP
jgi:hypothetical protein